MRIQSKKNARDGVAEIYVSGPIGESWWNPASIDEQKFREALDAVPVGTKVRLYVNSPGGSVADGFAMHAAIKRRAGDITAVITGEAMSIASFFPLAASRVITPRASVWMVHKPWSGAVGNSEDLRKMADALDKYEDAMVSEYVRATGKSEADVRQALENETYLTGEEAVAFGLADELTDDDVELEPITESLAKNLGIRRVPVAMGKRKQTAAQGGDERRDRMNRTLILALLKKHGVTVAEDATDEKLTSELDKLVTEKKVTTEEAAEAKRDEAAAKASAKAAEDVKAMQETLARVSAQLERERTARITKAVDTAVADGRIPIAQAKTWVARCLADETILADIQAMEPRRAGPGPSGISRVTAGAACALDVIRGLKTPQERVQHMRQNWLHLRQAEAAGQFRPLGANTGTDSATLLGTMQSEVLVTVLQTKLGPLRALSMDVGLEPMIPLRPTIVRVTTAGGTAQTNATNFEDTTNFVGTVTPVTVTPSQKTAGGHITNAELNSGNKMAQWATIKAQEIGEAIMGVVASVITTGNFAATPLTAAASAFSGTDLNTLWGRLAKAPQKFAIISSTYMARLLPTSMESINGMDGWPGWDGVFTNDYWTGATTNTTGFVCHPQAIAAVIGEPATPDSAGRAGLTTSSVLIPDVGVSIQLNSWFSLASRTDWMTMDVVFGASVCDGTAGIIIKSS